MAKLEIRLAPDEPTSNLQTTGAIYVQNGNTPPLVAEVNASARRASRFTLDPGRYEYRFHVERDAGRFTLSIVDEDEHEVDSDDFDTALGFNDVFQFEVP